MIRKTAVSQEQKPYRRKPGSTEGVFTCNPLQDLFDRKPFCFIPYDRLTVSVVSKSTELDTEVRRSYRSGRSDVPLEDTLYTENNI